MHWGILYSLQEIQPCTFEELAIGNWCLEILKCKCLEEMRCVNDQNYYHYHQIVSHLVEKCFILKELIMKLAKQGRIHLDFDEVVKSNHVAVTFRSFNLVPLHIPLKTLGACTDTIWCKLPKLKQTQVPCQDTLLSPLL